MTAVSDRPRRDTIYLSRAWVFRWKDQTIDLVSVNIHQGNVKESLYPLAISFSLTLLYAAWLVIFPICLCRPCQLCHKQDLYQWKASKWTRSTFDHQTILLAWAPRRKAWCTFWSSDLVPPSHSSGRRPSVVRDCFHVDLGTNWTELSCLL